MNATYSRELAYADSHGLAVRLLVVVALFGVVNASIECDLRLVARVIDELLLVALVELELQRRRREAPDRHRERIVFDVLLHLLALLGGEVVAVGVGIFRGLVRLLLDFVAKVFQDGIARVVVVVTKVFESFPCKR